MINLDNTKRSVYLSVTDNLNIKIKIKEIKRDLFSKY